MAFHCVESPAHFAEDLADAFYHDGKGKVILEKAIKGFEIGCAVMGNEELIAAASMRSRSPAASLIMKANMR